MQWRWQISISSRMTKNTFRSCMFLLYILYVNIMHSGSFFPCYIISFPFRFFISTFLRFFSFPFFFVLFLVLHCTLFYSFSVLRCFKMRRVSAFRSTFSTYFETLLTGPVSRSVSLFISFHSVDVATVLIIVECSFENTCVWAINDHCQGSVIMHSHVSFLAFHHIRVWSQLRFTYKWSTVCPCVVRVIGAS